MALSTGVYEVEILSHQIEKIADKPVIRFICTTGEGDGIDFLVWLTDKAMGMARASLRKCGFDPDQNITRLDAEPLLLRGKRVSIIVEDVNGRLRANLQINVKPSRDELVTIQSKLIAAKKANGEGDTTSVAAAHQLATDAASASFDSSGPGFPYGENDGKESDDDIPF